MKTTGSHTVDGDRTALAVALARGATLSTAERNLLILHAARALGEWFPPRYLKDALVGMASRAGKDSTTPVSVDLVIAGKRIDIFVNEVLISGKGVESPAGVLIEYDSTRSQGEGRYKIGPEGKRLLGI